MKHQGSKLLLALALLVPATAMPAKTRSGFCNEEAADVMRSKGCGSKCKKFCALSACSLAVNGTTILNGTVTINGVDLSSSTNRALDVLGTGLVEPIIGYAEYVLVTSGSQSPDGTAPNQNVSLGQPFTVNNVPVVDTIGLAPAQGFSRAAGTVYTLKQGTYIIDYETLLTQNAAIALGFAPTNNVALTIQLDSQVGGSPFIWLHGRTVKVVGAAGVVFGIVPSLGTVSVDNAGFFNNQVYGNRIVRLTVVKIA